MGPGLLLGVIGRTREAAGKPEHPEHEAGPSGPPSCRNDEGHPRGVPLYLLPGARTPQTVPPSRRSCLASRTVKPVATLWL